MIARSSRVPAGGSTALRTRWTRRSESVTVPSDSAQAAVAGRTTSASAAVFVRNRSWTTRKSRFSRRHRARLVRLRLDGVLADAVDRGQVAFHGIEHPRQVPAAQRRDGRLTPRRSGRDRVVLDVLETRQPVGQGAHVAAALDVVLATQRVDAAAVATDVTGQQDERDEGQDVVDRVVMLGDAEGPADHRLGALAKAGEVADGLGRDAGLTLGVLERVRLDLRLVCVEVHRRAIDEPAVLKTGRDDLAGHRVGQGDVAADVETEPAVGPLGRGRARDRSRTGAPRDGPP